MFVKNKNISMRDAIEPNSTQVSQFFKRSFDIISGVGGDAEASLELRKICVLFRDGTLLVDKDHLQDHQVRIYRDICLRKGILISGLFSVDIKLIRLLYESAEKVSDSKTTEQEPMERIAANLLYEASQLNVSDIHIKVEHFEAEIWFRRNGDMIFVRQMVAKTAHALLSTLYNAAEDADATYRVYDYQAARVTNTSRLALPRNLQSVRLQFNPLGAGGRYMIARLLYAENWWDQKRELTSLGFHPIQIRSLARLRKLPEGVNIISGPTGSGKSTTLKMVLELLYQERDRRVNILTIEDPPEYDIFGAAQLPVTNVDTEEERGNAYGKAITAALRSDPDIIMPGEARDSAVINLVFTAAMTGHQVWTSLHANHCLAVFDRLQDQGVESYKLSDPTLVTGIVSQRLVKSICKHCSLYLKDHQDECRGVVDYQVICNAVGEQRIDKIRFANNEGCEHCNSGYVGRTIVAEVLLPDQKFLDLIVEGKRQAAREYWLAHLDGITLSEHTWLKIVFGEIDPFDVWTRISDLDGIQEARREALIRITV